MTVHATLAVTALTVAPGAEVDYTLTVVNTGTTVEAYTCQVVGDAAVWARVEPTDVHLYPATAGQMVITFAPPRHATTAAGDTPFAALVAPTRDPRHGAAPEGVLHVLPYTDVRGEIRPRIVRSHRHSRHQLAIDNRGNTPLQASVRAVDLDDGLALRIRPRQLQVDAGSAAFATVHARHRRRLWLGEPVIRPFQVVIEPSAGTPVTFDGIAVQTPLVSRLATRLAALALVALLALVGAGLYLMKHQRTVKSAATAAPSPSPSVLASPSPSTGPASPTASPSASPSAPPSASPSPPSASPSTPPSGSPSPPPSASPSTPPSVRPSTPSASAS